MLKTLLITNLKVHYAELVYQVLPSIADDLVLSSDRKNATSSDCRRLIACKASIMRHNNYINSKNRSGSVGVPVECERRIINKTIENNHIYCFCVPMEFVWLL